MIATRFVATFLLLGGYANALELQLHPAKASFRSGEPVVVRLLVVNPLSSEDVPYLKRGFWLVPYTYPMDGDLSLSVVVRNPAGELLKATSASMMVVRTLTHPIMFQPLRPGDVFGQDIVLDGPGLEYDLKRSGMYRVTATLSAAGPRAWLDKWREANPREGISLKREWLFEGPVTSRPVDVQIVE